jgi:hypothetical protein
MACQRIENMKNMKPIAIILLVSVGYILVSLLSIGLLSSCSKEDQRELKTTDQQKWQLVKMLGSMTNSETTGKEMAWQEYIVFNADSTFLKSREQNGKVKEARGTYSISTKASEKYFVLKYNSGYELMASCYSGLAKEDLLIISPNRIIGTWNICDGPGLEYQLVEQFIID